MALLDLAARRYDCVSPLSVAGWAACHRATARDRAPERVVEKHFVYARPPPHRAISLNEKSLQWTVCQLGRFTRLAGCGWTWCQGLQWEACSIQRRSVTRLMLASAPIVT